MTNWKTTDFQSVNINYSNKAEGKYLISLRDDFVNGLSPFDLEARCGFKGATIWDYLLLCRDSVLDWAENEISMLEGLFWEIGSELKRHGMAIPSVETINVVKTTSIEEGGAMGYTRGNTIYVAESVMKKSEGKIEELLTHELFHILTRSSLAFKEEMYKTIGFTTTEKVIDLMALNQRCRFVSNPDVSKFCSYITLKDFSGKEHRLMMTTLARSNYNGGSLSRYILPYVLKLDDDCNVVTYDEKLPIRDCLYGEFYQDFITKVGKNTGYMTNLEEILAENFRFAVLGSLEEFPNPEIIDDIRYLMRG